MRRVICVLTELMIAAIQGVSSVLADRFIAKRENSATIRSVVEDVAEIKNIQTRDRSTLIELKGAMALVLERTDGLEVRRRKIQFKPTGQTPDVQSALLNLDLEIEKLRTTVSGAVGDGADGEKSPVDSRGRSSDPSSIFYQLDKEIVDLRRGEGDGQ